MNRGLDTQLLREDIRRKKNTIAKAKAYYNKLRSPSPQAPAHHQSSLPPTYTNEELAFRHQVATKICNELLQTAINKHKDIIEGKFNCLRGDTQLKAIISVYDNLLPKNARDSILQQSNITQVHISENDLFAIENQPQALNL